MNIGCDNEDINEAQLLGFLQTQLSEEQLSAALWIFRVYFQSGIASFAKVKIQEVGEVQMSTNPKERVLIMTEYP